VEISIRHYCINECESIVCNVFTENSEDHLKTLNFAILQPCGGVLIKLPHFDVALADGGKYTLLQYVGALMPNALE
jgi:hypothetical protein